MTSIRLTQELIARSSPGVTLPSEELAGPRAVSLSSPAPLGGDDDVDDELDPTEYDPDPEFYATALEDL